jgi:hypothetical protein
MLLLILSPGHGGAEEGWQTASSCGIGGDRGDQVESELIQAGGILASAILCRQDGGIATSDKEAIFESAVEARHCLATKWSRPWWLGDVQPQRIIAGREPMSYLLSFLGGDAWRTPASCG